MTKVSREVRALLRARIKGHKQDLREMVRRPGWNWSDPSELGSYKETVGSIYELEWLLEVLK